MALMDILRNLLPLRLTSGTFMRHVKPLELTETDAAVLSLRLKLHITEVEAPPGIDVDGPCWLHGGAWQDGKGFKKVKFKGTTMYVHRAMYTIHNGPIPDRLILDHLCRRRSCCSPLHLEPVTVKVNTERGNGKWIFEQGYAPGGGGVGT